MKKSILALVIASFGSACGMGPFHELHGRWVNTEMPANQADYSWDGYERIIDGNSITKTGRVVTAISFEEKLNSTNSENFASLGYKLNDSVKMGILKVVDTTNSSDIKTYLYVLSADKSRVIFDDAIFSVDQFTDVTTINYASKFTGIDGYIVYKRP